jgi:chitin disaccharide deacetylase
VRRLIVNADDFGLTAGVNRGIVEAHREGIVTSATLMASSQAFDDAVQLARSNPKLSVGCHLVLLDGSPLLDAGQIPSITDRRDRRCFRRNLHGFALRSLSGRLEADEIEAEATAQIRKVQAAGIPVSHIDTHKHTHMFPRALRPLLRAAQACGVRAIRNPFGRVVFSAVARHPRLWKRYSQVSLLNTWQKQFRQAVAEAGLITTDGSLGIVSTGTLDDRLLRFTLENLPEGTWEFVTHPGHNDPELAKIHTRLRDSRELELSVLTCPDTRSLLEREGVQLVSYHDLLP